MDWKKIAESHDLIVFEKEIGDFKLKIEARKANDLEWEVFKTKIKGDSSDLLSEYILDDKKEVFKLIEKLKSDPSLQKKSGKKTHKLYLKRIYKEEFVEKWNFKVDNENIKNVAIIKFDTNIKGDIILHEKYRRVEKILLSQLDEKLGLKELGESVSFDIYYFNKSRSVKEENPENEFNVDIEFDFSDLY